MYDKLVVMESNILFVAPNNINSSYNKKSPDVLHQGFFYEMIVNIDETQGDRTLPV
jgi:hypothetical protein